MVSVTVKCLILAFVYSALSTHVAAHSNVKKILNIAIIGAGASGLASAKNAIEDGHNVVIFEKSGALGGVWFYTDQIGKDEYGVDIHTPMYKELRTNTPYQTMEFPNFTYPESTPSYPSHEVVWKYLDSYAEHFHIKEHIKYHHLVEKIHSIQNKKWEISVKDMPKNQSVKLTFDAVFICIGISSSPQIPKIAGVTEFKGKIMHSRNYRKPEAFEGEDVLIVGTGPSGNDVVNQLDNIANRITLSSREDGPNESRVIKIIGNVKRFIGSNGVEFDDGTIQNFTVVIYATGYKYSFPFLSRNSGIMVKENHVDPLYKQILNIKHPTMAFIGIPFTAVHNRMYDLQARFALKFISGAKLLPSYKEMLEDSKMISFKSKPHLLGLMHKLYYKDLADTAEIDSIPEIYSEILVDALICSNVSPDFREMKYVIIDDENFTKEYDDNL
ncbi:dimethylaniline monooxygenase [N-oxide-forming] 3-like isoform X2 [Contarinia nasturtii]|uniref:dimethylaniline monooxygenase [N-oxide-forming] 3-like isoform X2 n=1 Tax=Contarinia nasturtii TaxID=265458 RepID=UPI0012D48EDA|nr:dimethylaniline monooxygenase [N-oxide-forming] 3-like isoform X2 [Contarinia nasturtii]